MLVAVPFISAQSATTATAFEGIAVNVRSGPGREYTVRGVVYPGYTVDVTGRNNFATGRVCYDGVTGLDMWLRIDFNGLDGWVARCAVDIEGGIDSLSVVGASNPVLIADLEFTSSDTLDLNNPRPDVTYVSAWSLAPINLRSGASLSSNVTMVIPGFEYVYVIGRSADSRWLRVQYQGETGWVARYLVQIFNSDWTATIPVQ
jgi:uncharacterized protein YraI